MSGHIKKDSRYRTIVREYGKVFVTWFGANFSQPVGSALKVGMEVELLAGSTIAVAVLRHKNVELGLPDEMWHFKGIVGGEKNRKTTIEEWTKITQELGHTHPVLPMSSKVKTANPAADSEPTIKISSPIVSIKSKKDRNAETLIELSRNYDAADVKHALEFLFVTQDLASTFNVAVMKKGFRTSVPADAYPEGYSVWVWL